MDEEYERLPEAIKSMITPKEFMWMPDEERNNILEDMTLPEVEED